MNKYLVHFKDGKSVVTIGDWYTFKDTVDVFRFNEGEDFEEQTFTALTKDIDYIIMVDEDFNTRNIDDCDYVH